MCTRRSTPASRAARARTGVPSTAVRCWVSMSLPIGCTVVTTALAPTTTLAARSGSKKSPTHSSTRGSAGAAPGRRTTARTPAPRSTSAPVIREPTRPLAPVTTTTGVGARPRSLTRRTGAHGRADRLCRQGPVDGDRVLIGLVEAGFVGGRWGRRIVELGEAGGACRRGVPVVPEVPLGAHAGIPGQRVLDVREVHAPAPLLHDACGVAAQQVGVHDDPGLTEGVDDARRLGEVPPAALVVAEVRPATGQRAQGRSRVSD